MNEPCYKNCNSIKFWSEYSNKKNEELRRTKRALWLARAERANEVVRTVKLVLRHLSPTSKYFDPYITKCGNWQWVERKCREKAEEFK